MRFIASVTETVPELNHRVLFYDICRDFLEGDGKTPTEIDDTLKDMYGVFSLRLRESSALRNGTHPLIKAGLVERTSDDNSIKLCDNCAKSSE